MGNWSKLQKEQNEKIEKDKTRKEKLAEYFFSLSNTLFGSLVIGLSLMLLDESNIFNEKAAWIMLLTGLFMLIGLARIGNNILK
jgi:uncharacterized membrane protein SirB2